MPDISKLLIQEPPLQVLPSLAVAIGLHEAIVLQQLYYLLRDPRNGRRVAEKQWIFNTYEQWCCQYFPFMTIRTIRRTFENLGRLELIECCQPEGQLSRRKYYRVNDAKLLKISHVAKLAASTGQNGRIDCPNWPLPTTETTAKKTSKNTKGHFRSAKDGVGGFVPKFPYPKSEEEMIAMLEYSEIEHSADYDGNFFETMTEKGWKILGKPIFDWISAYDARLEVTSPRRK